MNESYEIPVITLRVIRDSTVTSEVKQIRSPADAAKILMERYGSLDREVMVVMHLDSQSRLLSIEPVAMGSLNCTHVNMRELLKNAILSNSATIIVGHNHPSGNPMPSPEDVVLSKRIAKAAAMFDIELLDSLVVTADRFISLKERGLLD